MEKKINLVELLKDCPKGMELDCTICNGVKFIELDRNPNFPIVVRAGNGYEFTLTKYGQVHNIDDATCVIFPKSKTTWEGFAPPCKFKDGDIVATTNGRYIGITTGGNSESSIPIYCLIKISGEFEAYFGYKEKWMFSRFATEEEKQKLFDAIKAKGCRWNAETKKLEKLIVPRFKVGDRIKWKGHDDSGRIEKIEDNVYHVDYGYDDGIIRVNLNMQDDYELVLDKFDINTLKPFESRVLVRDKNKGKWIGHFFSHYDSNSDRPYVCIGVDGLSEYKRCIPYEGNEHLLGTEGDCDEYYKNWK